MKINYTTYPSCFPRLFYEHLNINRMSIFHLTGVCVGFPALLWALSVLYSQHKKGGQISFIIVFLLLIDLLELILNPILVVFILKESMMKGTFEYRCFLVSLIFIARCCAHHLNQLVALESIILHRYLSCSQIFSILLCIFVVVLATGCVFISNLQYSCVLPVIVCAVTCLLTCKATPDRNQATNRKLGMLKLGVLMFTLMFLYMPFFCHFISTGMAFTLDYLVPLRLISDPLLCVLICRETNLVQIQQEQKDESSI